MKAPTRRKAGLIVRELNDETLIYDKRNLKASCLDGLASDVWNRCDGRRSISAISKSISSDRGTSIDEKAVCAALDKLAKADLLDAPVDMPAFIASGVSRRNAIKTLGLGTAVASVMTIAVPSVVDAASCLPGGAPCNNNNPAACCSGICGNGVCGGAGLPAGSPCNPNNPAACASGICANGVCGAAPLPSGSPCNLIDPGACASGICDSNGGNPICL
jgi:hypothetical protein